MFDKAIADFNLALANSRTSSRSAEILFFRGSAYEGLGLMSKAAIDYQASLKLLKSFFKRPVRNTPR